MKPIDISGEKYERDLQEKGVSSYEARSPFWVLVRTGITQILLGADGVGGANINKAVVLSRLREKRASQMEPTTSYHREKEEMLARLCIKLPTKVFHPVLNLSSHNWESLSTDDGIWIQYLSSVAMPTFVSRLHLLVTQGEIAVDEVQGGFLQRPLMEWNYPSGLMGGFASPGEVERRVGEPVYYLYAVNSLRSDQIHEELGDTFIIPGGSKRVSRFFGLTPELVEARNQRWADVRSVKSIGIVSDEEFCASEMQEIAQRTTTFYEDLLRLKASILCSRETFWGDEDGNPLQTREGKMRKW